MTLPLINKQDTFEIVRDELAAILATEVASQQALATGAGEDPTLWKLRVFLEASNPWEQFLDTLPADRSPIVNVSYDNTAFDASASNVSERQTADAVYNIDCVGLGVSSDDGLTGQILGDQQAAFEAHRALRLVRNIFMSAEYTYLGMRGVVFGRWPQSFQSFQPQSGGQAVQHVAGARFSLRVRFNEFAPQVTGDTLDRIFATVRRAEDGEIVIQADYDHS